MDFINTKGIENYSNGFKWTVPRGVFPNQVAVLKCKYNKHDEEL